MNTGKTMGTTKTQRWNIHKFKEGQIILNLTGDGSYWESTGYRAYRPGALSVPTVVASVQIQCSSTSRYFGELPAYNKANRANFIKVVPI